MNGEPIQILLVEDNPGDVRLTREAFKDGKVANTIHVVEDGEQALAYIRTQRKYADAVRPDIILLDLNLPKKDGREVRREIKSDQGLKQIPVVVLTTSASEEDVLRTYSDYANCYITKPISFDRFIVTVRSIENFWLSIVKLPGGAAK